jgi:hypothetical protein
MASTPLTALFSGGKASADSFNARRAVERRSGTAADEASEVWDLILAVEVGGFLPRERRGSRILTWSFGLGARRTYKVEAVYTAVEKVLHMRSNCFQKTQLSEGDRRAAIERRQKLDRR